MDARAIVRDDEWGVGRWNMKSWNMKARALLALACASSFAVACGDDSGEVGNQSNAFQCIAGEVEYCTNCPDGRLRSTMCLPSGDGLADCPCSQPPLSSSGGQGGAGASPLTGGAGGMTAGAAGVAGMVSGGVGGMAAIGGNGGASATGGSGGMSATGGSGGMSATGGSGGSAGNPNDNLNDVRQVCVDTINMYRATLDLEPLARATPEQEMCSDGGAMMDADSGRAHGSAGMCELGSQNTCPGWPVGGWGGATLADSLKRCLQQMWDEGEPPVTRRECEMDYEGCFLQHGHYLNMSDPRATVVGCGFYDMGEDTWWMNQNFGLDWGF